MCSSLRLYVNPAVCVQWTVVFRPVHCQSLCRQLTLKRRLLVAPQNDVKLPREFYFIAYNTSQGG